MAECALALRVGIAADKELIESAADCPEVKVNNENRLYLRK